LPRLSAIGRDDPQKPENGSCSNFERYIRQISPFQRLTTKEEVALAARIKQGDQAARERMITSNLRLVVKIARDYEHYGVPLLDLISEGNIGLMKAVDRFNPAKGAKFSSFAAWGIKQRIRRALANQGRTIRVPVNLTEQISRMQRVVMQLQEELGRPPEDEEISQAMRISTRKVGRLRAAILQPVPMDAPVNERGSESVASLIRDESHDHPTDILAKESLLDQLSTLMQFLSRRELKILAERFGLDNTPRCTLQEVGDHTGLTRERVRQIQQTALAKLRRWLARCERFGLEECLQDLLQRH
jgi:RNA polymerase primary sigma factor